MRNTIQKIKVFLKLQADSRADARGFTFIELIFVISIFGIMSSIVLFGFHNFGLKTQLDNLAQDVALRIVEAQKAAISGRSTATLFGIDAAHAPSYGVYFSNDATDPTAPLNTQFTYFADNDHSKTYSDTTPCPATPTPGHECISVTTITTGEYVSKVCYDSATTVHFCPDAGSAHITFTRPFPDATMNVCNTPTGSCSGGGLNAVKAYIELTSGVDPTLQKTIIVTSLGEVRVYDGGEHDVCVASGLAGC